MIEVQKELRSRRPAYPSQVEVDPGDHRTQLSAAETEICRAFDSSDAGSSTAGTAAGR